MPVAGPRNQFRDLTNRNPDGELPERFKLEPARAYAVAGRSPGLMETTLRGCILGAGQIRRFYRQTVNLIAAQAPYSWTQNEPGPGQPAFAPITGVGITRAFRYLTRSVYIAAGTDNTRLNELHTVVPPRKRYTAITLGTGVRRNPPTIRNRMTSFGSRVAPINPRVQGAEPAE